jgi:hypothetical protein
MTATANELPLEAPLASKRALATPRARQPRRRHFRRSEFGRPKFVELETPIENPAWAQTFWERYAIPAGMAAFWMVFVASNWRALSALLSGLLTPQ